jgi:hypothetical protein
MAYEKIRNLDGTHGVRFVPEEPAPAVELEKPKLKPHQQMFIDSLQKNVLLRKMITITIPTKR